MLIVSQVVIPLYFFCLGFFPEGLFSLQVLLYLPFVLGICCIAQIFVILFGDSGVFFCSARGRRF